MTFYFWHGLILALLLILAADIIAAASALRINDCYRETIKWALFIDILQNGNLDITDPQVKPYINNLCLLLKQETGDFSLNNTLSNQILNNFYKSNPPPDSLKEIFKAQ